MLYNLDCLIFTQKCIDNYYELILADPPYNKCIEDEWDNQWQNNEEYLQWLEIRVKEFSRLLTNEGNLILYCKRQFLHHIKIILDKYLKEQRTIIWVRKRDRSITRGKTLASGYEPILWYSKSDDFIFNSEKAKIKANSYLKHRMEYRKGGILQKGIGLTDVWTDIPALPHNSKEKTIHSTQKPEKLSTRIIEIFSNNGIIFVPFAGSGSEIISAIKLRKNWDATEKSQIYFNLIKKRIKNKIDNLDKWIEEK